MSRQAIKVWLGTMALTAALAEGAAAQAPPPPTLGGGALPQANKPRAYTPSVNLSLQPRGGRIAMIFDSTVLCFRSGTTTDVMGGDEVAFDGTNFSFRGSGSTKLGRGRVTYRWTVKGQVSGGAATGTLHVTGVRRGAGRPRKCARKPDRAFALRLAPAPTGAPAQPQPRGFYVGTSTFEIFDRIQSPVILRATTDGRKISSQWTISSKCGRGPRDHFVNFTPAMRVRPDGTFSRSERFSVSYADALIRYRAQFSGSIKSDGATGTLRMRTRIYNRRGTKLLTRCDSGGRVWNAAPA